MKKLLTFGKYKNKPLIDILKKDKQYIIWLCKQPWYKTRYPELHFSSIQLLKENKPSINHDRFIVYTDGACPNNGNYKAPSSIGIHFSDKNSIQLPHYAIISLVVPFECKT